MKTDTFYYCDRCGQPSQPISSTPPKTTRHLGVRVRGRRMGPSFSSLPNGWAHFDATGSAIRDKAAEAMDRFLTTPEYRDLKAGWPSIAESMHRAMAAISATAPDSMTPIQVSFLLCAACMEGQDLLLEMMVKKMAAVMGSPEGAWMVDYSLDQLGKGDQDDG